MNNKYMTQIPFQPCCSPVTDNPKEDAFYERIELSIDKNKNEGYPPTWAKVIALSRIESTGNP